MAKSYQIEMTLSSKSGDVWICESQSGSTEKAAINKVIKAAKKSGYTNPRNIRAFVSASTAGLAF
ncbi:MAG: hypothetical protein ACXWAT_00690 [Methylobacter sp.]